MIFGWTFPSIFSGWLPLSEREAFFMGGSSAGSYESFGGGLAVLILSFGRNGSYLNMAAEECFFLRIPPL